MTADYNTQLAHWIETACLWEVAAPKAGNVHPDASFEDLTYDDFVRSARITSFMLSRVAGRGVSQSIVDAVKAVQLQVKRNTNLGIVLLIAPLAAVPVADSLSTGVEAVLNRLDATDSARIYQAIGLASPGGMGQVDEEDLSSTPTQTVVEVMKLAAERDLIARQYASGFSDVLGFGLDRLKVWWDNLDGHRDKVVIALQLEWMAKFPDTLIARKCGQETAEESASKASEILAADWPVNDRSHELYQQFDQWLRDVGHRKNPGTTADLIAATLFAGFRESIISPEQG